jgi:hypothetical protein
MGFVQSYVERMQVAALRDLVRVVWVQRVDTEPYVQRHWRTVGSVEIVLSMSLDEFITGPDVSEEQPLGTATTFIRR